MNNDIIPINEYTIFKPGDTVWFKSGVYGICKGIILEEVEDVTGVYRVESVTGIYIRGSADLFYDKRLIK